MQCPATNHKGEFCDTIGYVEKWCNHKFLEKKADAAENAEQTKRSVEFEQYAGKIRRVGG